MRPWTYVCTLSSLCCLVVDCGSDSSARPDPAPDVVQPVVEQPEPLVLSCGEIGSSALPPALKPVATFDYLTGWRINSEVLTLQWRQVDRTAGTVRLDPGTTKNDAGRLFHYGDLLPDLRDVLDAQWTATKAVEQARDRVSVGVPPERSADPKLPKGVARCGDGGRLPRADSARLSPDRRAEPGGGRCA